MRGRLRPAARQAFFGVKAHLAVDQGSGLVRRAILTPAYVNETVVADALIRGRGGGLRRPGLRQDGAARRAGRPRHRDGILLRGNRRPLTPIEVAHNRALVPIRAAIQRVFGTLKPHYGRHRVRYRGLARNHAHLLLLCLALDLRRAAVLKPPATTPPFPALPA